MSDSSEKYSAEAGIKRPMEVDETEAAIESNEPPDVAKKRPRGPSDCLDYDDSDEEEFTPFTQSNPEPVFVVSPKKVFAKKSAVARSAKKVSKKESSSKKSSKKGASYKNSSSESTTSKKTSSKNSQCKNSVSSDGSSKGKNPGKLWC